jgi:hypothetical protein
MGRLELSHLPADMQEQARAQLASRPALRSPAQPPRRESELQQVCERYLLYHGIWYVHLSHRARECPGMPDLLFSINGVPMAAELKTATGRLSGVQLDTHKEMERNGWLVAVCRTLDQFVDFIELGRNVSARTSTATATEEAEQ